MSDKKATIWRVGLYLFGMVVLALGLTLNTEAGLGSSAIISVPYTISRGTGISLANLTLVLYCLFVAAQFVIKGKNRKLTAALQIVPVRSWDLLKTAWIYVRLEFHFFLVVFLDRRFWESGLERFCQ